MVFKCCTAINTCSLSSEARHVRSVLSVPILKFNNATDKKFKPLEGQTKLSFAKSNEESQQVQEAVTAIDKDDATANEGKAQAQGESKNEDFSSRG